MKSRLALALGACSWSLWGLVFVFAFVFVFVFVLWLWPWVINKKLKFETLK